MLAFVKEGWGLPLLAFCFFVSKEGWGLPLLALKKKAGGLPALACLKAGGYHCVLL